jgi:hypothetical protein
LTLFPYTTLFRSELAIVTNNEDVNLLNFAVDMCKQLKSERVEKFAIYDVSQEMEISDIIKGYVRVIQSDISTDYKDLSSTYDIAIQLILIYE